MRFNWSTLTIAIVAITVVYYMFRHPIWELVPPYRRLRRRRVTAKLGEELQAGENLLDEQWLANGEGRLVWFALTDRRLLALRRGVPRAETVEVLAEFPLNTGGGLVERVIPFSWGMILSGAGLGGLGAALTWRFSDLWSLLLVLGVLVCLGGFVRIHYYDLLQGDKALPFWSFSSQGVGRFRARRFAKHLRAQLAGDLSR